MGIDKKEKFREFAYTESDFNYLSDLVKARAGINLSSAKQELVYGRLSKRLRSLNFSTFKQYCAFLEQGDEEELTHFINAITTNVTSFFRENHHFEFIAKFFLNELIEKKFYNTQHQIRIWSAGCSSGEEAYSIAMSLRENIPEIDRWDIKILATDLDSSIVEKAQLGVYELERIKDISPARQKRWFCPGRGSNIGTVSISNEIKNMVTFKTLNLTEAWPMNGLFDAIFCRNVTIYFDKPTRTTVVDRFADMMKIGGYFFMGHSESLVGCSKKFKLVGRTIYRKVNS